jgi:hypothetical protein
MHQSVLTSKAIYLLRLLAALLSFAVGGMRSPALDMVVDQFEIIGPRQWLWLLMRPLGAGWSSRIIAPIVRKVPASKPRPAAMVAANDNDRVEQMARAS